MWHKDKNRKTRAAVIQYAFPILLFAIFSGIRLLHGKNEASEKETGESIITSDVILTGAQDNMNSRISVSPEFHERTISTSSGERIPDIMSEVIMKSDGRKIVKRKGQEQEEIYISGPRIYINNREIPADSFYLEGDCYGDSCCYVICAACFGECGFTPANAPRITPYDLATMQPEHGYMISVDELEIHTTWIADRYDAETNTYWFTVTQDGPFSGRSDLFGTFVNGNRKNSMPVTGSVYNTQLVEYDEGNMYWTILGCNRDNFRYRIDRKYGTTYGRLPYKQDAPV